MKIAIASGKGGTGKTFLSTNLFATMKHSGLDAVLVDCDAEVPNASVFIRGELIEAWPTRLLCPRIDASKCAFCTACSESCSFHAITCIPAAKYIKVLPDLCHGCGACLLECPHGAVQKDWKTVGKVSAYGENNRPALFEARLDEGQHSPVPVIREAIKRAETTGADYLILDAPPGCSCPFVSTVTDADLVLLITEPTPFGLSDLKHTVEVLRRIDKPFGVIINRAGLGDESMKQWLQAEGISLLAEIPYSEQIASHYAGGELAVQTDTEMQELFNHITQSIIAHENSCN